MGKIFELVATGFYTGKIKFAPATFGSMLAVPLMFLTHGSVIFMVITLTILIVFGVISSEYVSRRLGEKDPRMVVIDEIAAYYMCLMAVKFNLTEITLAFVVFRVMDVVKPFPASKLENLPGGVGIMADDMVTGLYTILVMKILEFVL